MKILFPISLILTSIILFFLVTNPFYNDVKDLKENISSYKLALDDAKNLQNKRDELLEKYRNITQEDKDKLNNFLPDTVNNIKFILEIERIANLNGLPLKDVKFDSTKLPESQTTNPNEMIIPNDEEVLDRKLYGVFPVEFTTESTYESFIPFLLELERNLRLMDIKQVSFVVPEPVINKESDVNPNIYKFMFKVDTYWLK